MLGVLQHLDICVLYFSMSILKILFFPPNIEKIFLDIKKSLFSNDFPITASQNLQDKFRKT